MCIAVAFLIALPIVTRRLWPPVEGNGGAAAGTTSNRGSVAAQTAINDERQSDVAWSQSVNEVQSHVSRIEDELHASAVPSDAVGRELASIRDRLTELNKLLPGDVSGSGVSR
jgi:hypothetical protein